MDSITSENFTPLPNVTSKTSLNLEDIKMDSNFALLLCSLVFAVSWVIYITYYNSRVIGYIITKIVNKLFIGEGYFKIGKFFETVKLRKRYVPVFSPLS